MTIFRGFSRKRLPADSQHSNRYELCPFSSRHLFVFIRSGVYTVFALHGKETVSISVQSHLQVHRWCFVHKQHRIQKLSGPDVSCWTWDQGHHREHHICFLPRFTAVDWEGWSTSHFHLRYDFNFHITNFPFLRSNIPSSQAYGIFMFQLILHTRACSLYECFILKARRLSSKLLRQGFLVERFKSSFRKFYGRYGDLIQQYEVSLSRMLNDILTLSQQWLPNRSDFPLSSWPWYRAWHSPNYEWFTWSICNGCGMPSGNAYPSRHLVPSPVLGLACVGQHPVSSLHTYTFVVSRVVTAGAASQAGDADSSRAPGLTSGLQGSVNVHRGALLLVPQWQCISSFVFYIACAPIVDTRFLELAMPLLDFSPWISRGTFPILLKLQRIFQVSSCFKRSISDQQYLLDIFFSKLLRINLDWHEVKLIQDIRNSWCTLIVAQIKACTMVIYGRLDTSIETSFSCIANRCRHVWYSGIVFWYLSNREVFFIPCIEILIRLFIHQPSVSNYDLIMRSVSLRWPLWIWAGHYGNYRLHLTLSHRRIRILRPCMEWEIYNYK